MSRLTGPDANILSTVTIPDANIHAMTAFQAKGNSVILIITTSDGGGCTDLTFTAEVKVKIAGVDTEYADVIDRDSVWSMVCTTPDAAGVYAIPMEGLDLIPLGYYRLSYAATTAAGDLQVSMLNWENPKGGGADISTGDIIADMDATNTNTAASAASLALIAAAIGSSAGTSYMFGEDASFVTGDSPATVDVNAGLGYNGNLGWITNDGAGDFTIEISKVGTPTLGSSITIRNGEVFSFDGLDVDQFTITWVADSSYRYFIQ